MTKLDKWERANLRNDVTLGKRIDGLYNKLIQEASQLGVQITSLDEAIFAFDHYPALKKRAQALLQEYHDGMETIIVDGINSAWTLANNKNNELSRVVFGNRANQLSPKEQKRYFSNNESARDAFIQRKIAGMNLSDRVWKYTNQFKEEIELGLDVGIRAGQAATDMTADLKQYLKYPDKLFRRVKDEHGDLVLSKAAKAFHPGRGVYRSSYKNARRLTSTETNIAYRTADYLRIQDADYIVGIKIQLSNNHPEVDVCDELKGKYPKTFKFVGWHPHCRCHVETILKTKEEMSQDTKKILEGERPDNESVNKVEQMPPQFRDWIKDNKDRIAIAQKNGTLPYFILDNKRSVDSILHSKTALDIAKERHNARTPEQIESIRKEWESRKDIITKGNSVVQQLQGIPDLDTSGLSEKLKKAKYKSAQLEINFFQAKLQDLSNLQYIDDGLSLAKTYGYADIIDCEKAININMQKWSKLTLEQQKSKLDFEINKYFGGNMNNCQNKYKTWRVAQEAYRKQLAIVEDQIDWNDILAQKAELYKFKTKSWEFTENLMSLTDAITAKDKDAARLKIAWLQTKRAELEKRRVKPGKFAVKFSDQDFTKQRKDAALWTTDKNKCDAIYRPQTQKIWAEADAATKKAATAYTEGSGMFNRPLRGYDKNWSNYKGVGKVSFNNEGAEHDIELLTQLINKTQSPVDAWLSRGIESLAGASSFLGVDEGQLWNLIHNGNVGSFVGKEVIDHGFISCGTAKGTGFNGVMVNIFCPKGTKMLYAEPFSKYNGDSLSIYDVWNGSAKYNFGYEFETIIQRGTKFRITKAYVEHNKLYLDVDVIAQL